MRKYPLKQNGYRSTIASSIRVTLGSEGYGAIDFVDSNGVFVNIGSGNWDTKTGVCYAINLETNDYIPTSIYTPNYYFDLDMGDGSSTKQCDCGHDSVKEMGALVAHYDWCSTNK